MTCSFPVIRPLRSGEESAVLDLLTAWPFTDERKGEEFFARPMEHDPVFVIHDFWGAFDNETLVACCQIFPRKLRIAGEPVPAGGIGTVFTAEAHRAKGLGTAVVKAATQEMVGRGYEVALLHGLLFDFYEAQGYRRWGAAKSHWVLAAKTEKPRTLGPRLTVEKFDQDQHLEQVAALSSMYCADRHGTVVRNAQAWQASLSLAGNPVEEFVVAKDSRFDQVIAFLRGCMLNGEWAVLEWACASGHEEHLAELIAITVRTVAQTRVAAPLLADRELERCLRERGLLEVEVPAGGPEWMLQCLSPQSLAKRFGIPVEHGVLDMVLPPAAFHFWTSDRF